MFNPFIKRPRQFTKQELDEIREIQRIAAGEHFKADQIGKNTALVPEGKKLAKQYEATAALFSRIKTELVNQKLGQMGYPSGTPISVDLNTGKITVHKALHQAVAKEPPKVEPTEVPKEEPTHEPRPSEKAA